jgi:hypothetical protein
VRRFTSRVSHSQTVSTFQPSRFNSFRFLVSRSALPVRLACQNLALAIGVDFPLLQVWECQKQP